MITAEGVFIMKQDEMLSKLHLIFASRYKQVSAPQYYQGQAFVWALRLICGGNGANRQ